MASKTDIAILRLERQISALKSKTNKPVKRAKMSIEAQKIASEKWFSEKLGFFVVERGLKVELPTKKGVKSYEGVKLSNGKTAVFLGSGYLKYAWA